MCAISWPDHGSQGISALGQRKFERTYVQQYVKEHRKPQRPRRIVDERIAFDDQKRPAIREIQKDQKAERLVDVIPVVVLREEPGHSSFQLCGFFGTFHVANTGRGFRRMISVLFVAAAAAQRRRAAVVLRGMSVGDSTGRGPLDWRLCYDSLVTHYVQPRQSAGYAVDFYYHTYTSPQADLVRSAYGPKASIVTKPLHASNRLKSQQLSYVKALELVDNPGGYDEILGARFDILYKKNVTEWNIDSKSFNVPWRDLAKGKYCDVLWLFPGSSLENVLRDLRNILRNPPHKNKFGGELHFYKGPTALRLHLMFNGQYSSDTDWPEKYRYNTNPLYVLHRIRGGGGGGAQR